MSPVMPGRAVDLVLAAITSIGLRPYHIDVIWDPRTGPAVSASGLDVTDEATGRRIFAALGATDPTLSDRITPGSGLANLCGHVAALGMHLQILIRDLPPVPGPAELQELADGADALVADVDTARAAEAAVEDAATGAVCKCPDDRCVGYHHAEGDPCWCTRALALQRPGGAE